MKEIEKLQKEVEQLRNELAELRLEIDGVDDWGNSIHNALVATLPFLLRNHPEVEKVQGLLRRHCERYEELSENPERAENGEKAARYESSKILYKQLAVLGVWPGIDPLEAARKELGVDS